MIIIIKIIKKKQGFSYQSPSGRQVATITRTGSRWHHKERTNQSRWRKRLRSPVRHLLARLRGRNSENSRNPRAPQTCRWGSSKGLVSRRRQHAGRTHGCQPDHLRGLGQQRGQRDEENPTDHPELQLHRHGHGIPRRGGAANRRVPQHGGLPVPAAALQRGLAQDHPAGPHLHEPGRRLPARHHHLAVQLQVQPHRRHVLSRLDRPPAELGPSVQEARGGRHRHALLRRAAHDVRPGAVRQRQVALLPQRLRLWLPCEAADGYQAARGGARLLPDPQPLLPCYLRRQISDEELQEPQGRLAGSGGPAGAEAYRAAASGGF